MKASMQAVMKCLKKIFTELVLVLWKLGSRNHGEKEYLKN